jgi:exodeoxyribonuclease VII small subunit
MGMPEMSSDTSTDPAREIASMSFEQALEELEAIVKQLEGGRGRLEEAITSYERGAALKRHCEAKLNEARAKVERISAAADGTLKSEPTSLD